MRQSILAAILAAALPCAAWAQAPAAPPSQQDAMAMVYRASRNQLGVLQFCQAQGSVGMETVDLQRRLIGMLPPASVDGLDAAEAAGKRGLVVFGTNEMPIADAAKAQNTTADALCKQMATMLQAQAAQLPK